jgi:hypothetical protein
MSETSLKLPYNGPDPAGLTPRGAIDTSPETRFLHREVAINSVRI